MILALCGTSEGRELFKKLEDLQVKVIATVTTSYGEECLRSSNVEVITGQLNEEALTKLIAERNISFVIDMTHPYAENISLLTIKICKERKINYLRYERRITEIIAEDHILRAESYMKAAKIAKTIEGKIFLTVGSNQLPVFLRELSVERLIARVLPTAEVLKKCEDYGFTADNLIAMKGPFNVEINRQMFLMHDAAAVVTKDSGDVGGVIEKVKACQLLGIPLIIVNRPKIDYPNQYSNLDELINSLKNMLSINKIPPF